MFSAFTSLTFQEEVNLQSASRYIEPADNLLYFVNEVPIKTKFKEYEAYSHQCLYAAFQKAATIYGIKIIHPLRILLLRMLNQHLGFVNLHCLFLKLCLQYSVPHQALPILSYPAFFKHTSKNKAAEFIVDGCDILISLKQYTEAFELIKRGLEIQLLDNDLTMMIISRGIVLMIYLGHTIPEYLRQKLKNLTLKQQQGLKVPASNQSQQYQMNLIRRTITVEFYLNLKEFRALSQGEEEILKMSRLLEVYKDSQWTQLSRYIDEQVKQNNWRIKAQSIKNVQLKDLNAIKGINHRKEIYRYDCRNGIMYFDHKQADQNKLNSLITKAYNMSLEVSHHRIDRNQPQSIEKYQTGFEGPGKRALGHFSSMLGRGKGPF